MSKALTQSFDFQRNDKKPMGTTPTYSSFENTPLRHVFRQPRSWDRWRSSPWMMPASRMPAHPCPPTWPPLCRAMCHQISILPSSIAPWKAAISTLSSRGSDRTAPLTSVPTPESVSTEGENARESPTYLTTVQHSHARPERATSILTTHPAAQESGRLCPP